MTDSASDSATNADAKGRIQWNIGTLLCLTALVAAGLSYWQVSSRAVRIRKDIQEMKILAQELVVSDPTQYASISLRDSWFDEQRFQVYLPPGATYQLHLATRRIAERSKGAAPPLGKSVVLRSGTHIVTFVASRSDDDGSWTVSATCGGGPTH